MGNLFSSLINSTGALGVYGRVFNTIQNNITNANTPGYVKQDQVVLSLPFDPGSGLAGGIRAGDLHSSRSRYLEQAVRNQQEYYGNSAQRSSDLGQVETLFDLGSKFGVAGALNGFFNGASQLSVNPNDSVARQSLLDLAGGAAQAFHQSAIGLQQVSSNVDNQTRDTVAGINRIANTIAGLNRAYRGSAGASNDAGLDAQMHAALEDLSELTNYQLIRTQDGAVNVYLGGQTILVIGDQHYGIAADFSAPQTAIRDAQGRDIAKQVTRGRLGALLEEKNVTLPAYLTELDTLAQSFADSVNATLAGGVDRNGDPPAMDLFTYSAANGAAFTLAVNPLTPDQIAAADAAAPGGNGNAVALSQLSGAPAVNGFTFTQAYGNLGARVGRDVSTARQERDRYEDAVAMARAQRSEETSVSLDEEAAKLLQFQQAYQAVGKLIGVLNELTDTVLNLVR